MNSGERVIFYGAVNIDGRVFRGKRVNIDGREICYKMVFNDGWRVTVSTQLFKFP